MSEQTHVEEHEISSLILSQESIQAAVEDLTDIAAIVTGAGSGIGRAVSLRLARAGARVLAVDVDATAAGETADEATDMAGRLAAHQADVTHPKEVAAYVQRAMGEFGKVNGFFNNAGVGGVYRSIADTTEVEWQMTMAINLHAVFYGLKYVIPTMKGAGGSIVNTGSTLSLIAAPDRSDYVVSKHAVLGLTRAAACEGAPLGIRVNCICPGPIDTPMMARYEKLIDEEEPASARHKLEAEIPMKRYGRPDEIAEAVAFLLSSRSTYLSGAAVPIDGAFLTV